MTQPRSLTDPFSTVHKKDIKKDGRVVAQVDYVGWAQVADRLDEASPGWSFAIIQLGPDWCHGRLTLGDSRGFENIGYAENADADWKKEPLKDAVSDALKRCAALAGVARYLYDKDLHSPAAFPPPHGGAAGSSPRSAAPTPRPIQSTVPQEPEGMWEPGTNPGQCPVHERDWKRNSRGWFCSGKNGDGSWCDEHPSQAWMAQAS